MARLVIVAPIVQLLVFGYAVSTDVRHTPTIVLDRDQSRESRELVAALTAGGYFDVVATAQRDGDLADALEHGRAALALAIPPGYSRDLAAGRATRPAALRRHQLEPGDDRQGQRRAHRAGRSPSRALARRPARRRSTCARAPGTTPTSPAATTTCRRSSACCSASSASCSPRSPWCASARSALSSSSPSPRCGRSS